MLVLKIIAIGIFFLFLYVLMERINLFTQKKYSYKFFSESLLGVYIIIYAGLYFGYEWYLKSTDPLNGIVVMIVAMLIFIFLLIKNIKNTSLSFGLGFTFIQAVLFIPFCALGFMIIVAMIVYFSQTKPVYKIN